ncbi:MAG: hypothetical protein QOD10_5994 [Mycobacterium sp.]|jgi:hypothetical protein|nr:hypothetical protein [Mycobacterium sp.]
MSSGPLSPTVALVTKLVAKPDTADEVRTFLADAVRLANQEQGTIAWLALRTDTTTFWVVDAFHPRMNARRTWRVRSSLACWTIGNDSWTGRQRSSRPTSLPQNCPNEQHQRSLSGSPLPATHPVSNP